MLREIRARRWGGDGYLRGRARLRSPHRRAVWPYALHREAVSFNGSYVIYAPTTSLTSSQLSSLVISTDLGTLSESVTNVLINFTSDENILGGNDFFFNNNGFLFDVAGGKVLFVTVPGPGSWVLIGAGGVVCLVFVRRWGLRRPGADPR